MPTLNSQPSAPLGPRRVSLFHVLGGVLLIALGLLMFWALAATEFREKTMKNSRTGSVFTKGVTEQKIESVAAGLFMIGAGGYLGWRGLTRRAKPQVT